jgi:hypothetical protein
VNNPLYFKENDEHALDFVFICLASFGLGEFGLLHSNASKAHAFFPMQPPIYLGLFPME